MGGPSFCRPDSLPVYSILPNDRGSRLHVTNQRGGRLPKEREESGQVDRARDELFSHIRRCGVLEAEEDQRVEWLDDTMDYLAERYPQLAQGDLDTLRTMGETYCRPAIQHGAATSRNGAAEDEPASEITDAEQSEASAA